MPRGRQPDGEHALSNAERQARYRAPVARPTNRFPRSVTVGQRTDGPELSVGTTPSPGWSSCKPSMSLGMMRCPTACAIVPPPRRFRPLLISTSTRSSQSCPRAAAGATEPQRNQRTHGGAAALPGRDRKAEKGAGNDLTGKAPYKLPASRTRSASIQFRHARRICPARLAAHDPRWW